MVVTPIASTEPEQLLGCRESEFARLRLSEASSTKE